MATRDTGTGTSRRAAKGKPPADAIQMLEADHRKVEKLFNDFLNADAGRQQQIAQAIFRELEVHGTLEEEVFYPALQKQESEGLTSDELDSAEELDSGIEDEENEMEESETELLEGIITSAYDDHSMVRDHITRLRQMNASDPEFRQGIVELQDMITEHVSVEEDELFPHAQTNVDIKALGRRMQERKADILSEAA